MEEVWIGKRCAGGLILYYGSVTQLGECNPCKVEVESSILFGSTIKKRNVEENMLKNENGIYRWIDENEPRTETKIVRRTGCSLSTVLTIVFVVLKLCKVIDWNWFWVLSPTIFTVGLALALLLFALILAGIAALIE